MKIFDYCIIFCLHLLSVATVAFVFFLLCDFVESL